MVKSDIIIVLTMLSKGSGHRYHKEYDLRRKWDDLSTELGGDSIVAMYYA